MAKAFYIPNGPKNLESIFPGLDFNQIDTYTIEVLDAEDEVVATSTINKMIHLCEDDVRIHFMQYPGAIDSAIFKVMNLDMESKSELSKVPIKKPLVRSVHSMFRNNIQSNEVYQAQQEFDETELDWLEELFNTPYAWIEWDGIQGQEDDYLPIIIHDSKLQKKKVEDRFSYTVTVNFSISHEKINLRG